MAPLIFSYPTIAVSAIYCIWNAYVRFRLHEERSLRERVSYMLWVMVSPIE